MSSLFYLCRYPFVVVLMKLALKCYGEVTANKGAQNACYFFQDSDRGHRLKMPLLTSEVFQAVKDSVFVCIWCQNESVYEVQCLCMCFSFCVIREI